MSQISQLSISLSIHRPSLPVNHPPPSLPQLPVPQQPNLLLGHFRDKSLFLLFLPAPDTKQTLRQCSRKSMADIIYPKSSFGRASSSGPLPWEVGRVGGLAASYTRTSTDSDSTLLSAHLRISCTTQTDLVRTLLVLLIHHSQFRCAEQNGTEPPAKSDPARSAAGINLLVSEGLSWSCALQ